MCDQMLFTKLSCCHGVTRSAHSFSTHLPSYRPINLRELADEKWTTTSSEEFRAHKCGPIHLERRNCNGSHVFQGEKLLGNQERLSTTNQCFFPKIDRNQFPKHVDGPAIRTLSDVKFGRPELAGCFYSTTSQEQFQPKVVDRPKPTIYPSSNMLCEQGQIQSYQARLSKHDFRTTHHDFFVPKPYCKASLDNPPPTTHQPYAI